MKTIEQKHAEQEQREYQQSKAYLHNLRLRLRPKKLMESAIGVSRPYGLTSKIASVCRWVSVGTQHPPTFWKHKARPPAYRHSPADAIHVGRRSRGRRGSESPTSPPAQYKRWNDE